MSRLGKRVITLPKDVKCSIVDQTVTITKDNITISKNIAKDVTIEQREDGLYVVPANENIAARAMWGTCRSILSSMVEGVSKEFEISLEIVGVGYKAELSSSMLILSLGYSHDIFLTIPKNINVVCEKPTLLKISSVDKEALGQFVALIQSLRKKDPYKGKGIYKVGEFRRRKKGKNK